jgi:hypothetical protein
MEKQDSLKTYIKELPEETPSINFTTMVMNRIRLENEKAPLVYQPLIKTQDWKRIFGILMLMIVSAVLLHTFFPGNASSSWTQTIYSLDLSFLLKPFVTLIQFINSVPLAVITGIIAISFLVLFDQFYSRYARQ